MSVSPRYVIEPRHAWEPPQHVVIDGETGKVLSRHARQDIALATAEAMNHMRNDSAQRMRRQPP